MTVQKKLLHLWWSVCLGFVITLLIIPGTALAVNLLTNGSFDSFQSYNGENWRGFPERYGQGWSLKILDEDGLHFMDSNTFGQFATAIYGVPFLDYFIEGSAAQAFASRHHYSFVFSQTVAVTNGQDYAFGGKIVTFWKGSGGEVDHTRLLKRVGIDPSGGTDYNGPNVAWTDWDGTDNAWTSPAIAGQAQSTQMTAFFQVQNLADDVGSAYLNTGYIDSFKFELAPVASLNLPAQTTPGSINVTWSVAIPDPGFWNLWGYDVEYKDNAIGAWQTIQTHNGGSGTNTSYMLNVEAGKTYTFRARPWQQEAPNGSSVTTALPGLWIEKSITVGEAVTGRVINHAGLRLSGVTVSANGVATPTLSINSGHYALPTGGNGPFDIVASDFNGLIAPPTTTVMVSSTVAGLLTITLRPTGVDQAINNNDFETDLSGWNLSDGTATTASPANRHTGQRSLLISKTVDISQTGTVSGMRNPLLSFWYNSNANFTVEFLGAGVGSGSIQFQTVSPMQTKTLTSVNDWTHVILELGVSEVYTGDVGVNFNYSGGSGVNIFIDEVSIAAGPYKIYLPIVIKK